MLNKEQKLTANKLKEINSIHEKLMAKHGLKTHRADVDSIILVQTDGESATFEQLLAFKTELEEEVKNV